MHVEAMHFKYAPEWLADETVPALSHAILKRQDEPQPVFRRRFPLREPPRSRLCRVAEPFALKGRKSAKATLLPVFAKINRGVFMGTIKISLPDTLKAFVDQQVTARGYSTSSEYVRELIGKDQEVQKLRDLLLEGAASAPSAPADEAYFAGLRAKVTQHPAS
jgi:antitoxin ParD1/3/4